MSETTVSITEAFPDLQSVRQLHPELYSHRPSIEEYEAGLELAGRLTPVVAEAVTKAKAVKAATDTVVYIAGPLTGIPESLKERYGAVSEMLAAYDVLADGKKPFFGYVPHLHGTDPIKHPNVTPEEVRDVDCLWAVVAADYHVNFLSPTAHGNAIELGWAESRLIPTIAVNPYGNKLSRLTLGMKNNFLIVDDTFGEVGEQAAQSNENSSPAHNETLNDLRSYFNEMYRWQQTFPGRDMREFHFLSFKQLANPTLRLQGEDPVDGFTYDELAAKLGTKFIVYIGQGGHKHQGKIAHVARMDDYSGLNVITEDGYPYTFDPAHTMNGNSFWPVTDAFWTQTHPELKALDDLLDDPDFSMRDLGWQYDD